MGPDDARTHAGRTALPLPSACSQSPPKTVDVLSEDGRLLFPLTISGGRGTRCCSATAPRHAGAPRTCTCWPRGVLPGERGPLRGSSFEVVESFFHQHPGGALVQPSAVSGVAAIGRAGRRVNLPPSVSPSSHASATALRKVLRRTLPRDTALDVRVVDISAHRPCAFRDAEGALGRRPDGGSSSAWTAAKGSRMEGRAGWVRIDPAPYGR